MKQLMAVAVTVFVAMVSITCKKEESNPSGPAAAIANCDTVAVANDTKGGCNVRLVVPAKCQEIDLTSGKTFEVGWTTDGTYCETPWSVVVYGNPPSDINGGAVTLSENVSAGITHYGGILNITAADFAGITSYNGVYHWTVVGYYGSHPASIAFKVKK